jgi:hypothetical protein
MQAFVSDESFSEVKAPPDAKQDDVPEHIGPAIAVAFVGR